MGDKMLDQRINMKCLVKLNKNATDITKCSMFMEREQWVEHRFLCAVNYFEMGQKALQATKNPAVCNFKNWSVCGKGDWSDENSWMSVQKIVQELRVHRETMW